MEFCPNSGLPIDFIIGRMLELGLEQEDLRHLERLSDAVRLAAKLQLEIGIGGGLSYRNLGEVLRECPAVESITVGRAALSRALLVGLERRSVQPVIEVNEAAYLILRIRDGLEGMIEGFIGEVVVVKRPEVFSAVIVVILHDLRSLLRNVTLRLSRLVAGTLICRIKLDNIIGHACWR